MNTRRDLLLGAAALIGAAVVPPSVSAQESASLSPLLGYGDWLHARPTAASLLGKVVVVDVFTFGCYNCKNITPNLRSLNAGKSSSDFALVGVHTPETPYERERANVVENLKKQGVVWPVAIDNDNTLWQTYGIQYWPTQLVFDRHGKLRRTVIGDSQDASLDATIASLLAEHV